MENSEDKVVEETEPSEKELTYEDKIFDYLVDLFGG